MTDTFTIEQIEAAWANYWPSRIPEKRSIAGLIAELTRPAYAPDTEEVHYNSSRGEYQAHSDEIDTLTMDDIRPLTLTEHGPPR